MKAVILDRASFDRNDIDCQPLLDSPVEWDIYEQTTQQQTAERISKKDIIVTNKVAIHKQLISNAKHLKLILVAATGTDHIDLKACKQNNIRVCNVAHYATSAVTQHALTLMLNLLTHQITYQSDVKQGRWSNSKVFCLLDHPIIEAEGKTLGIIGYGVLGQKMAQLSTALGMKVLISERPGSEHLGNEYPSENTQIERLPFEQILKYADVISLHCPLTQHTKNLFNRQTFLQMKSTAILINTARGAIIDAPALVDALKAGEIAAAGIDVLDQEPPDINHPLLQPDIPNLIVTPHNAWGSQESRQRLVNALAQNLNAWLNNAAINVVI